MTNKFKNIKKITMVLLLTSFFGTHVSYAHYSNLPLQSIRWYPEAINNRVEGQRLIDRGIVDIENGHLKRGQEEIAEGQALKDQRPYGVYEWHPNWGNWGHHHWNHGHHRW